MRILHISSAKTFGGGERHLVDLCRELKARGHEIFVAVRPTCEWQDRLSFIPPENILHVSIRNSFGMFSAKRISKFIRSREIQLVHAHVARDYLAASVAVRGADNVKFVLTRHVVFPMKPFHRFALRNIDAAIGVSAAVGEQLEKIFTRKKVRLIPNGIGFSDADLDEREQAGREFRDFHNIPQSAPLVITIGELLQLKGQRDLILAAHEIVKKMPDCRFVIAGKDNSLDQSYRRELRRLVSVFRLDDNFLWLDWLEDTSPLLAAADLFVSPSHSESFGLAILEAMAAGKAVVASKTDGAQVLIDDQRALVPIRDAVALADTIVWYLQHPEERRLLGEKLERTAREKYGLSTMIDATEELYLELAG